MTETHEKQEEEKVDLTSISTFIETYPLVVIIIVIFLLDLAIKKKWVGL